VQLDILGFTLDFSFFNLLKQVLTFLKAVLDAILWIVYFQLGGSMIITLITLPFVILLLVTLAQIIVLPGVVGTPWMIMHFTFLPVNWWVWLLTYDSICSNFEEDDKPSRLFYILFPSRCIFER